ncbi:hypothetical protein [Cupriavidus necator]|uniref:hypothetical protein n=1 Tax=Cupriavidus necator TaxID=106590 RepID=UPI0005B5388C|nr:hypothetical protein [Cupriavidus necator]
MPGVFPKLLTSQDYGAPTLGATAGNLLAVLDACLLNGYGSRPVSSISVSGTTAQVFVGSGHGLMAGQVILISGANESQFNGEFKITAIGQTSVTVTVASGLPASATGTVVFKMAPLGWTKPFSGTNKAVYRTAATINTVGLYLRVDDNPTALGFANRVAQVTAYEMMTDVDTGFYPVPRPAQNVLNWPKSDGTVTNGGLRNWAIYGDDRFFYFWVNPCAVQSLTMNGVTMGFGDLDAQQTMDGYGAILSGFTIDMSSYSSINSGDLAYSIPSGTTGYVPRPPNGIGSPQQIGHVSPGTVSASVSGSLTGPFGWPDACTGGFFLNNVMVPAGSGLRGWLPGMYHILQPLPTGSANAVIQHLAQIDGMRQLVGKKLAFMSAGSPNAATYIGCGYFFDLTGPIRSFN